MKTKMKQKKNKEKSEMGKEKKKIWSAKERTFPNSNVQVLCVQVFHIFSL
jgi:aspartate-semialdehyde dehydrogenase